MWHVFCLQQDRSYSVQILKATNILSFEGFIDALSKDAARRWVLVLWRWGLCMVCMCRKPGFT